MHMKRVLALIALPIAAFAFLGTVMPNQANAVLNTQNQYVNTVDDGTTTDLQVIKSGGGTNDQLIDVIKSAINWVLGILALIALIILLYGGFLMVTAAGNEDGYKKWFTILRQAAIGLILIGIAWFIISIVFWLVNIIGSGAQDAGSAG